MAFVIKKKATIPLAKPNTPHHILIVIDLKKIRQIKSRTNKYSCTAYYLVYSNFFTFFHIILLLRVAGLFYFV